MQLEVSYKVIDTLLTTMLSHPALHKILALFASEGHNRVFLGTAVMNIIWYLIKNEVLTVEKLMTAPDYRVQSQGSNLQFCSMSVPE